MQQTVYTRYKELQTKDINTSKIKITFSRATIRVKWLNGGKNNVSRTISVLVLRVPKYLLYLVAVKAPDHTSKITTAYFHEIRV
jgi:hypothetical protein